MLPDVNGAIVPQGMARFVATHIGLDFPSAREEDLLRGLRGAAKDAGFERVSDYSEWLLSRPPQPAALRQLASHLTIGETYFFREQQALRALSQDILPRLIAERRGSTRHLRLWSAACSTGEEAYSLAIILHELLPDLDDWRITVLATDINPHSLEKAAAGVYGEWSFRTLPADLRARYFTPTADRRFAVRDSLRTVVTFAEANLAATGAPEYPVDAVNMDVILCRNLLIYFTADQGRNLVAKLHASLVPGGCLAVSPSEFSQYLFSRFVPLNYPETMLYRKRLPGERPHEPQLPAARMASTVRALPPAAAIAQPGLAAAGAAPRPSVSISTPSTAAFPDHATKARELANLGRLGEALAICEQWVCREKMNPAAHYLHATVLHELGDNDGARLALQRCIYLQADFALAHFTLGNLARSAGSQPESQRHYRNALSLLDAQPQEALLPESEGLTSGRLAAIVRSLLDPAGVGAAVKETSRASH